MRDAIPISTCRTRTHSASSDNRDFKPPDQWPSRQASARGADRARGAVKTVYGRDRGSEEAERRPPNFVVELRGARSDVEVRAVAERWGSRADGYRWFCGGRGVAVELYFTEWVRALEGVVSMWEMRFDGLHSWTPTVVSKVLLPSDVVEMDERLKALFCERVEGLVKGEVVERWEKRMDCVLDDIARVAKKMKRFNSLAVHKELSREMAGLKEERELVSKRLREFRAAMECVVGYLRGKSNMGKLFPNGFRV